MRYYGGKGVHGKRISKIILDHLEKQEIDISETIYLEPFCGALGVFRYIAPLAKRSYANDLCKDVILLWKQIQKGTFKNPKITEVKWENLKMAQKSSAERAFAGFGCSFGGVWFNGYIKNADNNDMQYSSLVRQQENILNSIFSSLDYIEFLQKVLNDQKQFVIYFDPPYKGTTSHPWERQEIEAFDSKLFWEVVRRLGNMKNVTVIVSEFSAPSGVKLLTSFSRRSGMHNTSSTSRLTEKLYYV